ncbi:hypothetical protein CLIB1444_19S00584 [[Candida] jaroonii]|uniref:Uncharacterized protein n=1 Tax=[Candida] jaroonii TaxID=467808 RepID=A0ACA9YGH1_9ASCO|nr:hypothetical protein CLIB1444_19S00584 [[Candida] jaroonii]
MDWNIVVDGGGTKTAVILGNKDVQFKGLSGSSNVFTLSSEAVVDTVKSAIEDALNKRNLQYKDVLTLQQVKHINIGLAGASSVSKEKLDHTKKLFKQCYQSSTVDLVSDAFLLPLACSIHSKYYITLIAGTGSSSMCFERGTELKFLGRSGGWGPHFGDNGGGYSIGRELIVSTLKHIDEYNVIKPFKPQYQMKSIHKQVLHQIVGHHTTNLSEFLTALKKFEDSSILGDSRKQIASLTKIIFEELENDDGSEVVAKEILIKESQSLVDIIKPFCNIVDDNTTLILSGSLFSLKPYKDYFFENLVQSNIKFPTEIVLDPASTALQNM